MRYFVGVMQPKSMGEYECGWSRTRYTVDDGEDADEVMKMMVSGCEEFDIWEVTKDEYEDRDYDIFRIYRRRN